jgi:hypothetical protein
MVVCFSLYILYMERSVPIILGGLVALVGIVYIVYKLKEQVSTEGLEDSVAEAGRPEWSDSQQTNGQPQSNNPTTM